MILNVAARRRSEVGAEAPTSLGVGTFTTYDGSGIAVHPSVIDLGREWNGYRWWQGNTPFPGDDERLENPSIWASNDRINWTVPPGLANPLRKAPAHPGYNSDTELAYDPATGRLICFYREVDSGTRIKAYYSTNGSSWTAHPNVVSEPSYTGAGVSPAVVYYGPGDWRIWMFGGSAAIQQWTATDPLGEWERGADSTVIGGPSVRWHGDVIRYKGRLIGVFSSDGSRPTYTMTSDDDGATWQVSASSYGNAYRPTLVQSTVADHLDVWIGTVKPYYQLWHQSRWPGF